METKFWYISLMQTDGMEFSDVFFNWLNWNDNSIVIKSTTMYVCSVSNYNFVKISFNSNSFNTQSISKRIIIISKIRAKTSEHTTTHTVSVMLY